METFQRETWRRSKRDIETWKERQVQKLNKTLSQKLPSFDLPRRFRTSWRWLEMRFTFRCETAIYNRDSIALSLYPNLDDSLSSLHCPQELAATRKRWTLTIKLTGIVSTGSGSRVLIRRLRRRSPEEPKELTRSNEALRGYLSEALRQPKNEKFETFFWILHGCSSLSSSDYRSVIALIVRVMAITRLSTEVTVEIVSRVQLLFSAVTFAVKARH